MAVRRIYQLLSIVWMVLIFTVSSQPSLPVPLSIMDMDKLLHALVYGALTYFVSRSSAAFEVTTIRRVLLVSALVTAYGITDEFHQLFVPGREASLWDILADGAGALIVTQILYWRGRHALALSRSEG